MQQSNLNLKRKGNLSLFETPEQDQNMSPEPPPDTVTGRKRVKWKSGVKYAFKLVNKHKTAREHMGLAPWTLSLRNPAARPLGVNYLFTAFN